MTSAQDLFLTLEQYLELESKSDVRHEYVGGRAFAMVGSTEAHNLRTGNVNALLRAIAQEKGCRAYTADMKLKIEQSVYYPDVMVTCDPYAGKSLYKEAPCVVVEVLSPSTHNVDRREKLAAYQKLPSLMDYLVVYQDIVKVEHYLRVGNEWEMRVQTTGTLKLACLGEAELDLAAIYAGTQED
jgi:Uma2 family endonuclease